jgi:hypothetical protein
MKNNVIKADFGGNPELNIDKLYNDLDPILNELTDVACNSLGEEEGCLYIQALSESIHKVADKLASKVEVKQNVVLSMDNGDIIDLSLETNE